MAADGPICNRRLSAITRTRGLIYLRRLQVSMAAAKWGGGMVDHQRGGSWLGREGWGQNQGMGADWVLSGLGVVRVVRILGHGGLPAALEPVALAVHLQDVDVVGEAVQKCSGEPF